MKTIKVVLSTIAILTLFQSAVFAVPTTTTTTTTNTVSTTQTRNQHFEQLLNLSIPKTTDNPNFIIAFKDQAGKGVKLEIDGQGSKNIKSPYILPSLGIGKHTLTFTFTDDQDTKQSFDETLIIIPRIPIIQAPLKVSASTITLNGTALAASQIVLYMSSGTKNYQATIAVADDGTWSNTFTNKFDYGIYNVVAITTMSGYASALSAPLVFELKSPAGTNNTATTIDQVKFSFNQFNTSNIVDSVKANPDLLYFTLIVLFLGFLIATILHQLINSSNDRKLESVFNNLLNIKTKENKKIADVVEEKKLTLREKLEKAKLVSQNPEQLMTECITDEEKETLDESDDTEIEQKSNTEKPKETEKTPENETKDEEKKSKKEGKNKEKKRIKEEEDAKTDKEEVELVKEDEKEEPQKEKVISKEEFLKLYKEDDPDSEEGKEILEPAKDEKKEESTIGNLVKQISVTLTSGPKNKK